MRLLLALFIILTKVMSFHQKLFLRSLKKGCVKDISEIISHQDVVQPKSQEEKRATLLDAIERRNPEKNNAANNLKARFPEYAWSSLERPAESCLAQILIGLLA